MQNSSQTEIDAVTYIILSPIIRETRYNWILPLVEKVLRDEFKDSHAVDLIKGLFPVCLGDEGLSSDQIVEDEDAQALKKSIPESSKVIRIESIEKLLNVGLVNIEKPIKLKQGLNIFFGKNATGKSSIYLALCKLFGIPDKNVYPNINYDNPVSKCSVNCTDLEGKCDLIEWKTGEKLSDRGLFVFDSQISNFLVEQDQENQFELSHLKEEYFTFLHNMYDVVDRLLQKKLTETESRISNLESMLTEKIPFLFDPQFQFTRKQIGELIFSDSDNQQLKKLKNKIQLLKSQSLDAIIKNLSNSLSQIDSILDHFATKTFITLEDGSRQINFDTKYTNHLFQEIDKSIDKVQSGKRSLDQTANKLSNVIPADWISEDTWERFIKASVEFLQSIDKKEKTKYTREKCPYCHQDLISKESKELIIVYQELQQEHESKIKQFEEEIKEYSESFAEVIQCIDTLPSRRPVVESEFDNVGLDGRIEDNAMSIKSTFEHTLSKLNNFQEMGIEQHKVNEIDEFSKIYSDLYGQFDKTISELHDSQENKDYEIDKSTEESILLERRRDLVSSKKKILEYWDLKEMIPAVNKKKSDISSLRRITSTLKTQFTSEGFIKEFRKCLEKEYNNFDFVVPKSWEIRPATLDDVSKRVYRLSDKRLSDILSEGEGKIHALSDFFAQIEMNKSTGVFIFDDPVNSLDEEKMEYVSRRIIDLVNEVNQVIVFTHSLVFLNLLIDTQRERIHRVSKIGTGIFIETEVRLGTQNELKRKLDEIKSRLKCFSEKEKIEISEYELRNVYDLMSGYLEDYVEIVLLKNVINRYRPNLRMHNLDDLKNVEWGILDGITKLYNRTSRKGSRHSQPIDIPPPTYNELLIDVRELETNFHYRN